MEFNYNKRLVELKRAGISEEQIKEILSQESDRADAHVLDDQFWHDTITAPLTAIEDQLDAELRKQGIELAD